jgi:3-methyl-2-oxobutanoate hydroxymethyltransferase
VSRLQQKLREGKRITVLTAYDAPFARLINQAGIDVILVNDGVIGAIALGRAEGWSTTIGEVVYHTKAVKAAAGDCLVASSMPFGTYNTPQDAAKNATLLVKEGGADAVHMEGGRAIRDAVKSVVDLGIVVIGHIGLTKQVIMRTGETKLQAKDADGILTLFGDAEAITTAGASVLVLECVPEPVARIVTNTFPAITIGIGAGRYCHGQFLVTQDILGLNPGFEARFLKRYADLSPVVLEALSDFRTDVEEGRFPEPKHTYHLNMDELHRVMSAMQGSR